MIKDNNNEFEENQRILSELSMTTIPLISVTPGSNLASKEFPLGSNRPPSKHLHPQQNYFLLDLFSITTIQYCNYLRVQGCTLLTVRSESIGNVHDIESSNISSV